MQPARIRATELQRARRIAACHDGPRIQLALYRTERRITHGDHGPRSVVVALVYLLAGLLLPMPILQFMPDHVSPIVPLLRIGSYFCATGGIVAVVALLAAKRRLRRYYATHSSWRILSLAAAAHGRQ